MIILEIKTGLLHSVRVKVKHKLKRVSNGWQIRAFL